ncbi:hypothetical protein PQ465_11250 [Sphingobacterium oryzagri]|uniref:DUF5045 domain-containing protein n=1 Tax=Sphingobacterium oryzagri TaxID=3025669 RepID=A0ABY7WEL0_9SPHI|nr:hypothetical protein [Sphingobacterium sp. KACC 22765]WDF66882.1 hypothetical protein PQ465_11250 [Sphingobacterium sp. KACC 22765]
MFKLYKVTLYLILCVFSVDLHGQNVKYQTDKHVVNQQERMVFKQWDRKKFTPTRGFLSLNYQYWLTWGLHPNYPKTDLRPLSAGGPQSRRLLMVAAMKSIEEAYKLHADTLRNTALSETANYAGIASQTDPLWQLYYKKEFQALLEFNEGDLLAGLEPSIKDYLEQVGSADWYQKESQMLRERLEAARTTNLDRGSRIIAYHRMLGEYRKLLDIWETKRQRAALYLSIKDKVNRLQENSTVAMATRGKSDRQIADDVLSRAKL